MSQDIYRVSIYRPAPDDESDLAVTFIASDDIEAEIEDAARGVEPHGLRLIAEPVATSTTVRAFVSGFVAGQDRATDDPVEQRFRSLEAGQAKIAEALAQLSAVIIHANTEAPAGRQAAAELPEVAAPPRREQRRAGGNEREIKEEIGSTSMGLRGKAADAKIMRAGANGKMVAEPLPMFGESGQAK